MPKVTELTASNSAANADLVVLVTNVSGTATTNKITVQNLASSLQSALPQISKFVTDSGNVEANSTQFSTSLVGANGIATSGSGNVVTISTDSTVVRSNVFTEFVTDTGNLVSNSTSSFSAGLLGSNGVITQVSGANVTITFDPSTINTLTDVTSPAYPNSSSLPANSVVYNGHTVVAGTSLYHGANGEFIEQMDATHSASDMASHIEFTLTANGTSAWNVSGGGAVGTDNETLYIYKGFTYKFTNEGYVTHPLQIRVEGEPSPYSNGISGGNAATYFTVPQNASGNLIYICTVHGGNMQGTLVIV